MYGVIKLTFIAITIAFIQNFGIAQHIKSKVALNDEKGQQIERRLPARLLPISPHRSRGEGLVTSEFVSRKVKVVLSCEPEETIIHLNFTEPFRGVALAGDTNSRCRIRGDGQLAYKLSVPHNSCDTQYVISKGSFVNKLFIRFHPSLEMGGDHSKTIVCKFGTGSYNVQ